MKDSKIIVIVIETIFLFLVTVNTFGQMTIGPFEGQKPSGSELTTASVNPYNGSLSFTLPLITIKGRGEASFTVNHTIMNEWSVFHSINFWACNVNPNCEISHSYNPSFRHEPGAMTGSSASGDVGYLPGTMYGKYNADFEWINYGSRSYTFGERTVTYGDPQGAYPGRVWRSLTRLTFVTNDGGSIEFYDVATTGKVVTDRTCIGSNPANVNRGRIFKANDASGTVFESDSDIYDLPCSSANPSATAVWNSFFNPSGYLKMKTGIVYRIVGGKVTWIKDKNGNYLSISAGGNSYQKDVFDSNGRKVNLDYSGVTYQGTEGAFRKVKVFKDSLQNLLIPNQSLKTYRQLFGYLASGTYNGYADNLHNPGLTSKIELPDGRSYKFFYNSFGELSRVEYPDGAAVEFDIDKGYIGTANTETETGLLSNNGGYERQIYRRVVEKRIYPNGGTGNNYETKTTYSRDTIENVRNSTQTIVTEETRDKNGSLISKIDHHYFGSPLQSFFKSYSDPYYGKSGIEGREFKTVIYEGNGITPIQTIEKQWENREPLTWWANYCLPYNCNSNPETVMPANDIVLKKETITLNDTNQVSKREFLYDQFSNQTDIFEYDYGTGSPGLFKRRTHTEYVSDPTYTSFTNEVYLASLPSQSWTSSDNIGNNKVSLTQYEYDRYSGGNNYPLRQRANVSGHDTTNFSTSRVIRGNLTAVKTFSDVQNLNTEIGVYSQYDILGNVVEMIDGKGNHSTLNYNDNFGTANGEARTNTSPTELNGLSTFAFPTSATNALGWITGYTQVDYFTGKPVDVEDLKGVISSTFYNDYLDRPTQTVTANNLQNFKRQTNIIYDDANRRVETKADLNSFNDNLLKSESFYDGLGRTIETRKYESDGGYVATKSVPFLMIQDPETSIYRAGAKTTNPYRPLVGEQPIWTSALSDSLGRSIKTITPDGAMVKTEYSGNIVTVTDQAGKKRRSITNAIGQLTRVDEPNSLGQLGDVGNPYQPTNYSYDPLGNLTSVSQIGTTTEQCGGTTTSCTQTRLFYYDSLSRLRKADNPESGVIQYIYDNNGNLTQKTDARQVVTSYVYDALNRVTNRNYSAPQNLPNYQATPNVIYTYDNLPNAKGNLIKVDNGISRTEYQSFDPLGRVVQSQQFFENSAFGEPMTYTYNLSGALVEQKYPSGRVVKNVLDNDGDLAMVQSKRNAEAGFWNYAKHFTYTAAGAVASMQYGNSKWESTVFNVRLQPTQIALGSTQNATDNLKLNFDYGQANNNGNVLSQTITVPTVGSNQGFTAVQTYSYDSLNRIKDAKEMIGTSQQWKQTFQYDRYGNRRFDTANNNTTTLQANCPTAVCNPQVDAATNKLVGYTFDNAGNTSIDAENRQFIYDAENKQVEVKDSQNNIVGKYFYDGDGKRVKKISVTETTVFVYNASGQLVAEYSTNIAQAQDAKVSYLTNDHLGSPRITTDAVGNVTARHDYQPFGEEVQRASHGTDQVRQKFTGYERDKETDLDFAQARFYNAKFGRFYSPDPENFQALHNIERPQSWNAYSYVNNNPCNSTDPTGLCDWCQKIKNFFNGYGARTDAEVEEKTQEKLAFLRELIEQGGPIRVNGGEDRLTAENIATLPRSVIWYYADDIRNALQDGRYIADATLPEVTANSDVPELTVIVPQIGGGANTLTGSQSKNLRKIRNNINNHLTEKDLQALIRELSGNPLTKSRGELYNHWREVTNAVKGVKNGIKGLEKALKNPDLAPAARAEMEQAIQEGRSIISRVEAIIKSH